MIGQLDIQLKVNVDIKADVEVDLDGDIEDNKRFSYFNPKSTTTTKLFGLIRLRLGNCKMMINQSPKTLNSWACPR